MMRAFLIFFFCLTLRLWAATGDILAVAFTADGGFADVTVEGFTTGASYDFGLGANNSPLAAKVVFTVVSEGFNAAGSLGTITRTIFGTSVRRKDYPDELQGSTGAGLTKSESTSGGNLTVRIALSDYVYDDDNTGAGKSGTAPVVSIAAGFVTNSGGGAQTSAAATALPVTNSSTQGYPKAFGQWAMVPYQRFTSTPTLRFTARHRHGIARVAFSLSDGTTTATAAATTETARQRSGSSLYATEFAAPVSMSALTQNIALTGNAVLYPTVGDADSVFDTSAVTANDDNRALGQCAYPFWCDKNNALTVTKYVATTGNNTTGDGSQGNPWLTIGKALTDGTGNDIEVAAGTYNVLGSTVTPPASLGYFRVVRTATGASVTLELDADRYYKTPHLCYRGFTIHKTAQNAWMDGETGARYIWFDQCNATADASSVSVVHSLGGYQSACSFQTDCTIANAESFGLNRNFGARIVNWYDGCVIVANEAVRDRTHARFVACSTEQVGLMGRDIGSTTGPFQDPCFVEFNSMKKFSAADNAMLEFAALTSIANGLSLVGTACEVTGGPNQLLAISADTATTTTNHVLIVQCTLAGERANLGYNETGSTAYPQTLWRVEGNILENFNNKDDTFAPANGNRTGAQAVGSGVGFAGNFYEGALFPGEFLGLNSKTGTTDGGIIDPLYVDDQAYNRATNTPGTGGGDLHLQLTSTAIGLSRSLVIPYDQEGRERTANDAAGAYRTIPTANALLGGGFF